VYYIYIYVCVLKVRKSRFMSKFRLVIKAASGCM